MTTTQKVRENRLRRAAERQGFVLHKSGRRDPRAVDYGKWWVCDGYEVVVAGGERGLTTDELAEWLDGGDRDG